MSVMPASTALTILKTAYGLTGEQAQRVRGLCHKENKSVHHNGYVFFSGMRPVKTKDEFYTQVYEQDNGLLFQCYNYKP